MTEPAAHPKRRSKIRLKHLAIAAGIVLMIITALSLLAPGLMSSAITGAIKDIIAFFVIVFKL